MPVLLYMNVQGSNLNLVLSLIVSYHVPPPKGSEDTLLCCNLCRYVAPPRDYFVVLRHLHCDEFPLNSGTVLDKLKLGDIGCKSETWCDL